MIQNLPKEGSSSMAWASAQCCRWVSKITSDTCVNASKISRPPNLGVGIASLLRVSLGVMLGN